jgi:iron complex outermembrane recepter protein
MKFNSVAVAVAAALGTAAGWAAEPAQQANELEEVIVTAQYRAENLQDTAIAITAISGDRLEDQGIQNVEDLGLVIPNAQIRSQGSFSGPTPAVGMRGVITTDFIYTSEPGVGVYIDEIYQGTLTGSAIDLLDVERVEVLRGPQGTLFGKNSLGGAIRLFSKQPKGDDTGHFELTYGTSNRLDLRGSYDFAINDNLFLRVSGVSKSIDGYQDVLDFTCQMKANGTPALAGTFPTLVPSDRENKGDCRIGERGGGTTDAGRVMLRWLASDAMSVDLWADYTDIHAEPLVDSKLTMHQTSNFFNNLYSNTVVFPKYGIQFTGTDRFLTGNPFKTFANPIDPIGGKNFPPDTYTTAWDANGKFAWKFGDKMEFDFIAGYRTYETDWMGDGDQMPIDLNHTYNLQSHEQWTLEARLQGGLFDDRLDWTAGLYRYDDKSHLGGYVTLPAFAAILPNFNQNDSFTATSNSAFVHGIFKVTDALSLTAGIRYTDESKTYAFDHSPYLLVPGVLDYGSSHTDWKLGADYRFNPEVMVYVSAATGFRSDGAQPRPFTPGQQKIPVPAEELTSYEIGMKTDLFDRRLRINLAAFIDDYDPRIFNSFGSQCAAPNKLDPGIPYHGISATNPCPVGTDLAGTTGVPWFVYDSAPGKDKGVELEVSSNPIGALQVNATLAWFDFKSGVDATDSTGAPNFGYVNPDYKVQAELSGSLGAQYTFNLGNGTLTPRVDWFYQGSRSNGAQYLPQYDENQVGGYGLMNARINYATSDGKWNVALIADNLLDKFYWYTKGPARDSITGSFAVDNRVGSPARGREVALSLQRNFN